MASPLMSPYTSDPDAAEAQFQQRQQAAQQTAAQQQAAQLQRTNLENQQAGNTQLAKTAAADAAQWGATPGYTGADNKGAAFGAQAPEFRQHMMDAYGPIADQVPGIVNQTQRSITGNPAVGLENLPAGAQAISNLDGEKVQIGSARDRVALENRARSLGIDPTGVDTASLNSSVAQAAGNTTIPSGVREELIRMGKWKEGMTPQQASDAFSNVNSGQIIPAHLVSTAREFSKQLQGNPTIREYAKVKDAYDNVESGFKNPQAGGFGDMSMIEGFQRMVNPGAAVRTQTMQNMQQAAGWLKQLDPSFQWDKAVQGDKLNPEARQRLYDLSKNILQNQQVKANRALAGARNAARSYGFPDPEGFVNNSLNEFVNEPEAATTAQPTSQYQSAIDWLGANPNDPKAAAVKAQLQKLGALK